MRCRLIVLHLDWNPGSTLAVWWVSDIEDSPSLTLVILTQSCEIYFVVFVFGERLQVKCLSSGVSLNANSPLGTLELPYMVTWSAITDLSGGNLIHLFSCDVTSPPPPTSWIWILVRFCLSHHLQKYHPFCFQPPKALLTWPSCQRAVLLSLFRTALQPLPLPGSSGLVSTPSYLTLPIWRGWNGPGWLSCRRSGAGMFTCSRPARTESRAQDSRISSLELLLVYRKHPQEQAW